MLSRRIAALRKASGMSQAQLSQKLNLSPSAAGMYEQGRRTPSIDILVEMAKQFNVSLDYLLTGSEFQSDPQQQPRVTACPCLNCKHCHKTCGK